VIEDKNAAIGEALEALLERESFGLRLWSSVVITYLLAIVVGCVGLLIELLVVERSLVSESLRPVASAILSATMGSALSALYSLLDRRSRGWEFDNGRKWPASKDPKKQDKREMFVMRMVPWFIVRPWFGTALGLVFYLGFAGGYLATTKSAVLSDANATSAIAFVGFLVGLMAKTFIQRLRAAFEALFGAERAQHETPDGRGEQPGIATPTSAGHS
jgi:hypothetical protein